MITASSLLARVPPLFSDLAKILQGEIDCSHETLTKYSEDKSPYFVFPQAVIFPKNGTDIKHVLSFAREYKMPVTVRGSGEARTGGALGEGIILDMTRYFSHIRNINMMEHTVTVDAGVTVESLVEKLRGWQYEIPLVSLSDKGSTIGAIVSTKSANESSYRDGTIREWVEGLTVIVDTGEEHKLADGITPSGRLLGIYQAVFPLLTKENPTLRAAKPELHDDATGYNLWNTSIGPRQLIDQLVGSEGTLGIITSVTLRIAPIRKHSITTCIPIQDKSLFPEYLEIIKQHKADGVFMYDEGFMQLSERYHPTLAPFFMDTPYVLLVTHKHNDLEKLHHLVQKFKSALPIDEYLLKTLGGTSTISRIMDKEFLYSLFDMYTNQTQIPNTTGDGMIVENHILPQFLEKLEEYLNSLGKLYVITGNIASGHVSVVTLFDPKSSLYQDEILFYNKNLFELVREFGGGISAVGGDGMMRTPYLSLMYSDATLALFKNIKDAWDPLSILNPGKKTNLTTNYLVKHLKRQAAPNN